jgi:pimeloyl-ACP methyl ester carboxylesterase
MRLLRKMLFTLVTVVILAFIVLAILYFKNNTEVKTLSEGERKKATGSFIQLTDGITHYELAGPDTGRLVVLVHGFSVPYYIWDSTYPRLIEQGYRVLRFDAFGRGWSDRPDKAYEATLFRNQLSELLSKLQLDSVYALAGISFGGAVVTDFTLHYPQKVGRVILVDPVYPWAAHFSYPEYMARYKLAINPEDMANGQLTDLKYPERFPHWAEQYKVEMQYKGFRRALISTRYHYAPGRELQDNYLSLEALHKPVLLIWGKEDKTVPFVYSDSLRSRLHTEFLPVEDAAHLPAMEKPALVNKRIIDFLKNE